MGKRKLESSDSRAGAGVTSAPAIGRKTATLTHAAGAARPDEKSQRSATVVAGPTKRKLESSDSRTCDGVTNVATTGRKIATPARTTETARAEENSPQSATVAAGPTKTKLESSDASIAIATTGPLEDAPLDSLAYQQVKYRQLKRSGPSGNDIYLFRFKHADGTETNFQTTVNGAAGSHDHAERICRACYAKFESGESKENILLFRAALYEQVSEEGTTAQTCSSSSVAPKSGKAPAENEGCGADDEAAALDFSTPEPKTRQASELKPVASPLVPSLPAPAAVLELKPGTSPPIPAGSPSSDTFRDATPEERNDMPRICMAFDTYLKSQGTKDVTRTCYGQQIVMCFAHDGKAPAVMATASYCLAVRKTLEDCNNNHLQSAALGKFANFWSSWAVDDVAVASEVAEEIPKRFQLKPAAPRRSLDPEGADGSEVARAEQKLPEGWRVFRLAANRNLAWCSPGRRVYFSKGDLNRRLPPDVPECSESRCSKRPRHGSTPDVAGSGSGESQQQGPRQALRDIFNGPASVGDAATADDKMLLARVLVTFREHVAANPERRQSTCDNYVMMIFKLFSLSGRRLEVFAQPEFANLVVNSEDNRKCHGQFGTAIRAFATFWQAIGGYEGKFAEASRDMLNKTLNVRPLLTDIQKQCGFGGVCQRPKQRCETCGSTVLCSKHGSHEVEECRNVFWATHSADGTRMATMRDFMRPKSKSSEGLATPTKVDAPAAVVDSLVTKMDAPAIVPKAMETDPEVHLEVAVMDLLREAQEKDGEDGAGVSLSEIIASVPTAQSSPEKIKEILAALVSEGDVFTTIDKEHFSII